MSQTATLTQSVRKRRSRFLRFSLRTLLIVPLLAGTIGLVVRNWDPWVLELRLDRAQLFRDGTRAIVYERTDGAVRLAVWDLAQARKLCVLPLSVNKVRLISDDARRMVVLTESEEWQVYDLEAGKVLGPLPNILRVDALSPDGTRALGLNQYYQYAEFDIENSRQLYIFEFPQRVRGARYQDGMVVVCSGKNQSGYNEYAYAVNGKPMTGAESPSKPNAIPPANDAKPFSAVVAGQYAKLPFPDGRVLSVEQLKLRIQNRAGTVIWERDTDFRNVVRPETRVETLAKSLTGSMKKPVNRDENILFQYAILDGGRRVVMGSESLYTLVYRNRHPEPWWACCICQKESRRARC